MLDQTLQDWRKYQQCKRRIKLANMDEIKTFPCLALFGNNYVEAYLKIIEHTTERCIRIISRKRRLGLKAATMFEIPLAWLRGYDKENSKIILTLKEEVEQKDAEEVEQEDAEEVEIAPIVLQFINADTLDAAFAAVQEFGRERVKNLPPPPSTFSESD